MLTCWMLICGGASGVLWNAWFRPRVGARWMAALVVLAFLPVAAATLRAGVVYGPFDTNLPNLPWAAGADHAYAPSAPALNDVTLQFAPWQAEVRRQLLAGRLPLLNRWSAAGEALLGNGQAAPFSLVSLLALPFDPVRAQGLRAFLKLLLALLGSFAAARQLGCRPLFALFAATAYAWGGSLAVWQLFPHAEVMALFPFAFLSVERLLAAPRDLGAGALLFLSACGILLSGHPETALTGGAALAGRLAWAWRSTERSVGGRWRCAALLAMAVLATSFFTLPLAQSVMESEKLARQGLGRPAEPATAGAAWASMLNMASPGIFGTPQRSGEHGPAPLHWLAEGSVGLCCLALAAAAILAGALVTAADRYLAWLAVAAYSVHLDLFGLAGRLFALPLASAIDRRYFAYLGGFAVALLAARGLGAWCQEDSPDPGSQPAARGRMALPEPEAAPPTVAAAPQAPGRSASPKPGASRPTAGASSSAWRHRRRARLAFWGCAGAACALALGARWAALRFSSMQGALGAAGREAAAATRAECTLHWLVGIGAALGILLCLALARRPALAAAVAVALAGCQLRNGYGGYVPVVPAEAAYPPLAIADRLRQEAPPFRITGTRGVFFPNNSTWYQLADLRTHDPTEPARYVDFLVDLLDLDRTTYKKQYRAPLPHHLPALRLLGTRFLLARADLELSEPWIDLGRFRDTRLWRLGGESRWAFFPQSIIAVPNAAAARVIVHGMTDPYRLAALETAAAGTGTGPPSGTTSNGPARVERLAVEDDRLRFDVSVARDAWLVVSQAAIPGWRARGDGGVALRTAIADGVLVAVRVPAGTHQVELRYLPASFLAGAAISGAALAACCGLFLGWRRTPAAEDPDGGPAATLTAAA